MKNWIIFIVFTYALPFSCLATVSINTVKTLPQLSNVLSVASQPIFQIGTAPVNDDIIYVATTACPTQEISFDDCWGSGIGISETQTGSFHIVAPMTLFASIPAFSQPLNVWINAGGQYASMKIRDSNGNSCTTPVVPYTCTSDTSCTVSFTRLTTCNF